MLVVWVIAELPKGTGGEKGGWCVLLILWTAGILAVGLGAANFSGAQEPIFNGINRVRTGDPPTETPPTCLVLDLQGLESVC